MRGFYVVINSRKKQKIKQGKASQSDIGRSYFSSVHKKGLTGDIWAETRTMRRKQPHRDAREGWEWEGEVPAAHCMESGFHSKYNGNSLESLKQKGDRTWLTVFKRLLHQNCSGFYYYYWRIIALKNFVVLCQTSAKSVTGKHSLPTTQEKTLHMDITRWSTPKSDWVYSLQPKMEKLYTVSKNKTGSWLWLRFWTPYCQIQT